MDHEQHTALRVWNPLGFLHDLQPLGPLDLCLLGIAVIVAVVFFILIARRAITRFFGPSLFLAIVPFVVFTLISYFQFYDVLSLLPATGPVSSLLANAILGIQYPLQFGIVSSAALLLFHTCAYVFLRSCRNA